MTVRVNVHTGVQRYKLWKALEEMAVEIANERPSRENVVRRLTEQLGFEVTENNVLAAVKAGVIPPWKPDVRREQRSKPGGAEYRRYRDKFAALEESHRQLDRDVRILRHEVDYLVKELGIRDKLITHMARMVGLDTAKNGQVS